MPKPLHESSPLTEAATSSDTASGRMRIACLTPGWGTTGYYSTEVVEAAAPLFKVGTQMYLDHPHQDGSGLDNNGNRSVRDIAAVITEGGTWDAKSGQLVAECQVIAPYRETLIDLADHIGLSLRGSATDIAVGEAEGRTGPIIEGLDRIDSIDFVARAGRGGRILQVLESARPSVVNARALEHGISEATVNDTREALQTLLRDAYGSEKVYVWVRDFDDSTVWFEVNDDPDSGIFGQPYTQDDSGAVALTGNRTEVRVVTNYVPVTRSDSNTTTATESQEDTMPKIQIEESEHVRLTETAGRVDVLESENATLKSENTTLKEADAQRIRTDRARVLLTESATAANVTFSKLEERGLLADLPLTESGDLDEAAFTTAVTTAATESAPKGVRGFGESATEGTVTESAPTTTPWGRPLTVKGA